MGLTPTRNIESISVSRTIVANSSEAVFDIIWCPVIDDILYLNAHCLVLNQQLGNQPFSRHVEVQLHTLLQHSLLLNRPTIGFLSDITTDICSK